MNAPVPLRQIAVVADEEDFQRVVLARVKELNVSRRELSIEAGLTESYAEKVLCGMKGYGPKSRWGILAAIGYAVIIVEDPAATKRFAQSMAKRDHGKAHRRTRALVMSGRIPWLITKEKARELGAKGGTKANSYRSKAKRRRIGKMGALIRWDKVKAAVKP